MWRESIEETTEDGVRTVKPVRRWHEDRVGIPGSRSGMKTRWRAATRRRTPYRAFLRALAAGGNLLAGDALRRKGAR